MHIELTKYKESKPHYLKMVTWRVLNFWLFQLLPNVLRLALLRLFGAKIGRQCLVKGLAKFYAPWNFTCGDAVCIGPGVEVYNKAPVVIGSRVVISQDAYLCTASHDPCSRTMDLVTKPIAIGDDVWLAAKTAVMPGVTVEEGTVVAACSVVTHDTKAWTIVGGHPAVFLKERKVR